MRGIPTVLITVSPEVSAQMRPPRALYPKGFKIGNSLGRPGMRALQKRVRRAARAPARAAPSSQQGSVMRKTVLSLLLLLAVVAGARGQEQAEEFLFPA